MSRGWRWFEGRGVLKRKPRMDGKMAYRQNNMPESQSHDPKLQPSLIRHAHTSRHWWGCMLQGQTTASRGRTCRRQIVAHAAHTDRAEILTPVPSLLIRLQVSTSRKSLADRAVYVHHHSERISYNELNKH